MTKWLLYASFSDHSGEPKMLELFDDVGEAQRQKDLIEQASPIMNLYVVEVPYFPKY